MKELSKASKIGIVGGGTMGAGIALAAATHGHRVFLFEVNPQALENAKSAHEIFMIKSVEKGKADEATAAEILKRINYRGTPDHEPVCDFYIEAIVEDFKIKQDIFVKLESITPPDIILATNTSSLSITSIASVCKNPERVLGMHFFNPAQIMPLVEIVPGLDTSHEAVSATKKLMSDWGKTPVIAKDTPGFIVNRVARPFYGEALRILEEGIADVPTIDWAMKEIGGFKMGPFGLMDLIGNDVNYAVTETVFREFYFDPRFKPSFIQKQLVEAKRFGRKTGIGFYNYDKDAVNPAPKKDETLGRQIFNRILYMLINEAADAVFLNVASKEDVDLAMTKGTNYPKGLLKWADEIGTSKVVNELQILFEEYGEDRYRVNPLLKRMAKNNQKFYD